MTNAPPTMLSATGVEAIVIAGLAVLFAAVWRRGRDPGMPWLAAGFALAAVWYFNSLHLRPSGPLITSPAERFWSIVIASAVLCVATGVVRYLGTPKGRRRWLVWACGLPGLVQIGMLACGLPVSHRAFHIGVLLAYLGASVLAFSRAALQPGDGHALLGAALLTLAATPHVMAYTGVPTDQLSHIAGLLLAIFGMVLLTVTLLRRQRALSAEIARRSLAETELLELNSRLESRVQQRTAHLRELVSGLQTFNRGVSHDLRGPLSSMSGLARLAAEALARGDPRPAERALPLIAHQCEVSMQMVGAMLELARIGDSTVQREPVNLHQIARSAYDEAVLGLPEAERPVLHCGPLPVVRADPRLLRPVFVNLIGNALKFSAGRPAPRIEIEGSISAGEVTVCVHDNGIGFTPDMAERLFEPFYRGHGASHDGHGLGLSIVRRAVEAMGGQVSASRNAWGGASLCFRLPDATLPAPGPAAVATAEHVRID